MNRKDFDQVVKDTVKSTADLLVIKGEEYSGNDDRLSNFKRGSERIGITSLQVALIYASKHFDAICTYVKKDSFNREQILSEPIEGRFDDLINYCILMKALVKERNEETQKFLAGRSPLDKMINTQNVESATPVFVDKIIATSSELIDGIIKKDEDEKPLMKKKKKKQQSPLPKEGQEYREHDGTNKPDFITPATVVKTRGGVQKLSSDVYDFHWNWSGDYLRSKYYDEIVGYYV